MYTKRLFLASFAFAVLTASAGRAQTSPYPYPYYPQYGQQEGYGNQPMAGSEDHSLHTNYGPQNAAASNGAMFPSRFGQWVGLPQPSGPLKAPPPRAAIVQVRVPTRFANVRFDGEPTSTDGTNRYFVTPELPEDKTHHYTVSVTWKDNGEEKTKERKIDVKAGHTTVVDFTRPDNKKSP